jgi:hypothetical protein
LEAHVSDVLINLVLDKSGSMGGLEGATCEGINAFFKEQRELDGKAYLSMTLFDTSFDVRFVGHDLAEVPDLGTDGNRFVPSGGTALYDAVAVTIKGTDEWLLNHRDFTGKVVCVINTDGEENSSKSTSLDDVNNLITEKTAQGWEFVFMGVGKAAWTEGQKFSAIPQNNYFRSMATAGATNASYAGVSRSLSHSRVSGAAFSNSDADAVITGDEEG